MRLQPGASDARDGTSLSNGTRCIETTVMAWNPGRPERAWTELSAAAEFKTIKANSVRHPMAWIRLPVRAWPVLGRSVERWSGILASWR
jgi:hypothetical protein